jgi:hypothetical protein
LPLKRLATPSSVSLVHQPHSSDLYRLPFLC